MATGETGFDDVTFDLISVQYHSLKPDMITASMCATLGMQAETISPPSSKRSCHKTPSARSGVMNYSKS